MRALVLFALLAVPALAQPAVLLGTVRDADGAPLPGASVYLSGTARGTSSQPDGAYRLTGIPPGAVRLVGSMVGFTPEVHELRLGPGDTLTVALTLAPTTQALGAVAVEARRDGRWAERLEQFRRTLIGESENADSTRILNPEVLDFRTSWGSLMAEARAPLVIENRALGYRLTYDLHAFEASATSVRYDGDERFEALVPASDAEAERWAAARARAFRGSLRHLLQSLMAGATEADGFGLDLAREDTYGAWPVVRANPDWLIEVDADGWATLHVRGRLDVTYSGEPEEAAYLRSDWFREPRRRPDPVQRSSVFVDGSRARIDPQGTPEDPFAVSVSGHLAFERLADLVPAEYVLPAD